MVKTLSCQCRGTGLRPGWGTEIPHAGGCSQKMLKKKKKKAGLTNFCNLLGQNNVTQKGESNSSSCVIAVGKCPGGGVSAGTGQSWEMLGSGGQDSWQPLWSQLEFERVEETRGQPRSGSPAGLWRSSGNFPEPFSGGGEGLPWKPRS